MPAIALIDTCSIPLFGPPSLWIWRLKPFRLNPNHWNGLRSEFDSVYRTDYKNYRMSIRQAHLWSVNLLQECETNPWLLVHWATRLHLWTKPFVLNMSISQVLYTCFIDLNKKHLIHGLLVLLLDALCICFVKLHVPPIFQQLFSQIRTLYIYSCDR